MMAPARRTPAAQARVLFEVHIKQAGGKSARPGTGARQGYPYEQQQRPVQSAAGFGLELTPGFLPLFSRQR